MVPGRAGSSLFTYPDMRRLPSARSRSGSSNEAGGRRARRAGAGPLPATSASARGTHRQRRKRRGRRRPRPRTKRSRGRLAAPQTHMRQEVPGVEGGIAGCGFVKIQERDALFGDHHLLVVEIPVNGRVRAVWQCRGGPGVHDSLQTAREIRGRHREEANRRRGPHPQLIQFSLGGAARAGRRPVVVQCAQRPARSSIVPRQDRSCRRGREAWRREPPPSRGRRARHRREGRAAR